MAFTEVLLPSSAAAQPDGAIVVAGSSETAQGGRVAMVRVTPNGQMDTTFGNGRLVTV